MMLLIKPHSARKRWHKTDDVTLIALIKKGHSITFIANALGRTSKAILSRLSTPLHKAITKPKQKAIASRKGKLWSDEEHGELIRLFELNFSVETMAAKLNRTVHGVLGRLAALKLIKFNKDEMAYYRPTIYYTVAR